MTNIVLYSSFYKVVYSNINNEPNKHKSNGRNDKGGKQ